MFAPESSRSAPHDDPAEVYRDRLARRRDAVARLGRSESRIAWLRLVVFAGAAGAAWLVLGPGRLHPLWLLAPLAGFLVLVLVHDRVIRGRQRAERAAAFYERALARLEDRWSGTGSTGARYLDPGHPYAADLDLFGEGSLFQRICGARTATGEETLAAWLLDPAEPAEVLRRQAAVRELRPRLDLREALVVLGADASGIDPAPLRGWAAAPSILPQRWPVVAALLLGLANLICGVAWVAPWFDTASARGGDLFEGAAPFAASVMASVLLAAAFARRARRVLAGVERPARELEILSEVLRRLEAERFEAPLLVALRAELDSRGKAPSARIRQLARLVQIHESRANLIFGLPAALLLAGTQLAFALERWRRESGASVGRWLDALGRFEALSSLAGLSYERPADPFPELTSDGPSFVGRGLGHPLLPDSSSVRNDVTLTPDLRLWLVSGSNMSGKSTLLRTVGLNAVLAQAGAPVRAEALRLSPLAVGACMRVQDSLQQGTSHFYAEIRRLREIVELGRGGRPLLFLLDEILHGTNSHDRRNGAAALIRGLVEQGGIGLVTTHDLALAGIADELAPRAANVHFADHLEGDRMVFDYRIHPGVVQKSNALALMRRIGLDV